MPNDLRRFPRMSLDALPDVPELKRELEWPNFELTEVLDLSYKGLLSARPGLLELPIGATFDCQLRLANLPLVPLTGRIAWLGSGTVGIDVVKLEAAGRRNLSFYTDALDVGARMTPRHIPSSPGAWFGAGASENVSVSFAGAHAQIGRVLVESEGEALAFERGQALGSLTRPALRALLVLSQMDKPDLPMKDFLRALTFGV